MRMRDSRIRNPKKSALTAVSHEARPILDQAALASARLLSSASATA